MPRQSAVPRISGKESTFHQILERVVDNFTPRKKVDPFRVPRKPVDLTRVLPAFFDPDDVDIESLAFLRHSDETTLLQMEWDSCPGLSSSWSVSALTLPSRRRVYVVVGDMEHHVIAASAPTFVPEVEDARFLHVLARSNGAAFGTGVIGSAPSRVLTDVKDLDVLVGFFKQAFDVADAWESFEDQYCGLWETPDFEDLPEKQQQQLDAEFDREQPPTGTRIDMFRGVLFDQWIEERLGPSPEEKLRRWLQESRANP